MTEKYGGTTLPPFANATDHPVAVEDTSTIQEESLVPYPVINTIDSKGDNRIRELNQLNLTTEEGKLFWASLVELTTRLHADKTPFEVIDLLYAMVDQNPEAFTTKPNHNMEEQRPLTFGEKDVGISFNPGKNPTIESIKHGYASIIDLLNDLRVESESPEAKRMLSIAITESQSAQMWAVKAATWQY